MPVQNKSKEYNPYSINFRQLQRYNFTFFSLEEIVLFEYFMLLAQTWKYKPFYHSTNTITKETGIKRSRIDSAIVKFESIGIISVEVKGFPKVKFFTINPDMILSEFSKIFQLVENSKLYDETYKLYVEINKLCVENNLQEKLKEVTNKETKKTTKEKKGNEYEKLNNFSFEDAKKYVEMLETVYNKRREYLAKETKKRYPPTVLGFKNNKTFELVRQAMNERSKKVIENAWLVMIDKITLHKEGITKLLPYFFSLKEGEFNVIDSFADIHNTSYTYSD